MSDIVKSRKDVEKGKEDNQSSQVRDMYSNMTRVTAEPEQTKETDEKSEQETTEEVETQKQESTEQETQTKSDETQEEPEQNKDEVVSELRQRVAELETGKAFEEPEKQTQEPSSKEEPAEKSTEEDIQEMASFISNEEFEEMQTDPNKFNEVLARVYQKARQDTLQDIPEVVERTSQRQMSLRQAVHNFYSENPGLREHGQYVGYVVNQIKNQNPDMPVQDILNKAGERVRNDLAINEQAKETETQRRKQESQTKDDQPAFAKRGSGSHKGGKQDTRNDFQKQADEMIQTLR